MRWTPGLQWRWLRIPKGSRRGSRAACAGARAGAAGRYVRNPEVAINIKSSVSQVVTVNGQVVEPGLYPVTNQMTLMRGRLC